MGISTQVGLSEFNDILNNRKRFVLLPRGFNPVASAIVSVIGPEQIIKCAITHADFDMGVSDFMVVSIRPLTAFEKEATK